MKVNKSYSRCSNCGGEMVFCPTTFALMCDNCGTTEKIKSENSNEKHIYNENIIENSQKTTKTIKCSNCGAEIPVVKNEITKSCPYCGSKFVIDVEDLDGLKPDLIIPFKFDREKAIEYYKLGVKKKFFAPKAFKKAPNLDSLHGTYIPCFSFDSNTKSSYNGSLRIAHRTTINGRTETTYSTRHISGKKDLDFKNFLIESSVLAQQESFEQIKPFIFDERSTYKYNADFIRGYEVENYTDSLKSCKLLSETYMKEKIKNAILMEYHYDSVNYFNLTTTFNDNKYAYILVPVYFIDFKYKNKNYRNYLNGQTGKLCNNLPKSGWKIFFCIILTILLVVAGFVLLSIFA